MLRVVHQIFFNIGKGSLNEIERFKECHIHNHNWCKKNNIKYHLWDRQQVNILLKKYPQYQKLYDDYKYDIQRIDFARYLILFDLGGIYIDLDIKIIDDIHHLFALPYFFVKWNNDKLGIPYNAVLGAERRLDLYLNILNHCRESFYTKKDIEVYKYWKGRFVFQTTGHYMLMRVLKKNKIPKKKILDILKIVKGKTIIQGENPLFEDYNISVWYSSKSV